MAALIWLRDRFLLSFYLGAKLGKKSFLYSSLIPNVCVMKKWSSYIKVRKVLKEDLSQI